MKCYQRDMELDPADICITQIFSDVNITPVVFEIFELVST